MRGGVAALALLVALIAAGCNSGDEGPTTRVVLEVIPAPGREVPEERLERAAEIMRDRIEELGGDVTLDRNEKQFSLEVPQENVDRFLAVLTRTGRLEFFDLQGDLVEGVSLDSQGFPIALKTPPKERPSTVIVTCRPPVPYCPGVEEEPRGPSYYLFRDDPDLTGADLRLSGIRQEFDTRTNEPIVLMQFTREGARRFEAITRKLVERGRAVANQQGLSGAENDIANQQFAIVLDGELKSAPVVDFDDNPSGIPGESGAQITNLGSLTEAKDLAVVLRTGALPFDLRLVSREETGK
jgi:preprotein translocase subunit SecD